MKRDEALMLLFNAYKSSANIEVETIKTYTLMLADLPLNVLFPAVRKCINTCKFLPSIAEIREAATTFKSDVDGTRQKDYAEAWSEVEKALKEVGYYGKPTWSSPEIARTVQAMGWMELCCMEGDAINTTRAQFRQLYEIFCKRATEEASHHQMFQSLPQSEQAKLGASQEFVEGLTKKLSMDVAIEKEEAKGICTSKPKINKN